MFRITPSELDRLVTNCDRFSNFKHLAEPPFALTEHGAIQAANVLNSNSAVEMSVIVVRTFVKMRQFLKTQEEILRKLDALEHQYDEKFQIVFEAIKELMAPPLSKKKSIGFGRN